MKIIFCLLIQSSFIWCSSWKELDRQYHRDFDLGQFRDLCKRVKSDIDCELNKLNQEILNKDLEINKKNKEINLLNLEISSKIDIIVRLDFGYKNLNIYKGYLESENKKVVQLSQELSAKMESVRSDCQIEKERLEDIINHLKQPKSINYEENIELKFDDVKSLKNEISFLLNEKKILETELNNRTIEKAELSKNLSFHQEIIEKKKLKIETLKQNLLINYKDVKPPVAETSENGEYIANLTETSFELVDEEFETDLDFKKEKLYLELSDVLHPLIQKLSSNTRITREQRSKLIEMIKLVKRTCQEIFNEKASIPPSNGLNPYKGDDRENFWM
jgi:hypothetical protein